MRITSVCHISNLLGFILALLLDVVDHSLKPGALLVHFLQAYLGILLLGLQVLQAAALPFQIILQALRVKENPHRGTCVCRKYSY